MGIELKGWVKETEWAVWMGKGVGYEGSRPRPRSKVQGKGTGNERVKPRKQEQDRNPDGDGDGSGGNGELGMENGETGRWMWPMVMLLVAERGTLRWSDNAEKGLDSADGSLKRDTARSGQNRTCINFFYSKPE